MASRKRGRSTTRRRSKAPMINVLNLAEAVVVGSAVTKGVFGTSLVPFLTEGWLTDQKKSIRIDNSWEISLAELFQPNQGRNLQSTGMDTLGGAIRYNLRQNGGKMVATLILAPMAFRVGKKLAGKPINMMNKFLKPATGNMLKI